MLDLLFDDTRWFTEDEVQFTVQASLSAMGVWVSARGAFAHYFLISFSRSTGAGDQVYLVSPYQSELEWFDFMLVTDPFPSLHASVGSTPCLHVRVGHCLSFSQYQKGTTLRATK